MTYNSTLYQRSKAMRTRCLSRYPIYPIRNFVRFLSLMLCATHLSAVGAESPATAVKASNQGAQGERTAVLRRGDPMDMLNVMNVRGLSPDLQDRLNHYYSSNFGSYQEWSKVQSIQLRGRMQLLALDGADALEFCVQKQKPNSYKLIIRNEGERIYMAAFDGEDAWHWRYGRDAYASMSEAQAIDFVRDASFGGHLLMPTLEGKEIRLGAEQVVDGMDCFRIEVTPPGLSTLYYDISEETHLILRQVVYNCESQRYEEIHFSDYRLVDGFNLPFKMITQVDGVPIVSVALESAWINPGLTGWFFERPTARVELEQFSLKD